MAPLPQKKMHFFASTQVCRKDTVLHERDLREKTRKAAEKRRQKMGKRLSQGEKKNAKRMATVAAVYTTDLFERSPEDLVSESGPRIKKMKRPPIIRVGNGLNDHPLPTERLVPTR